MIRPLALGFALISTLAHAQVARNIQVPGELKISSDPVTARAQLARMDVRYLWKLDGSDIAIRGEELFANDFLGNGHARSEGSAVSLKSCVRSGQRVDSFVLFERPAPDSPLSGYLKVEEKSLHSKLDKKSAFTIGGWFKQYPTFIEDFRDINPGSLAPGFMPALVRFSKTTAHRPGMMEWMFHLTAERGYLNINRQYTGQNDMNQQLPWWAHTFGTCYENNQHSECWHYISVAVDPAKNSVQFVIVRQAGWSYGDSGVTDYVSTGVTDAYLNNIDIPTSAQSVLHIGGNENTGTHGIIRGLYFARKALTPVESKALSIYTAPTKKGFNCGGRELR